MKKTVLFLIDFYRNYLSGLMLKSCRFYPSCSVYAKEAVKKKGVLKGILLGSWRILRCNPLSRGGYDPVDKVRNNEK
ncbi:MAG: membrane protein insertion efficiency factor YidD [Candidatus Omnitrophica bacterium]|nr:membrane protein insertion efficiency factor YidD [Candidatus Omnitrophota bacterium]MBU4479685.1 membrane protein insertion efficiency factor YidD [Candidatus Omnitrophota bacterium]MCG2703109.1 membrane protein insertion efficiency factor YidD [Candidatus Omnitrophota bacterium]